MTEVAVIGAGPAGMTASYVLAKNGVPVHLYEASAQVGGMARSIELWGQIVDIGPHRFFTGDARVNALWLELAGKDYEMVDRLTRIFFRNKFYRYPIQVGNVLRNLGVAESALCVASYVWWRLKPGGRDLGDTFESWVTARFGKRLYGHFFKTYTEKLWGIPGSELSSEFAAQRIGGLSLWEAVKHAVLPGTRHDHKTLVDQFAYPSHGSGQIYERMRDHVEAQGGTVHLRTPVHSLVTSGTTVTGVRLASGEVCEYDEVISSMPLTLLVDRFADVPPEVAAAGRSLEFRNTLLVYLLVDADRIFPDNWIYVHSTELRTGRITNFRNWVPTINRGRKETILAMEYWSFDGDDCWHWADERHIELAKLEIVKTGLVEAAQIKDGAVVRVPRCYPVYRRDYRQDLAIVEDFLRGYDNLQVIGRYGAFKYNNQDHSILMGILAANNIIDGAPKQDLWNINSDYDYQESSLITQTGLVKNA
ncbi:MAG TPA: FAD-dependent oxidoreductase [Actinophytocola sp.]|uniref:FAD-dependent oxidoreductase n=1 Tax=Actinophytocola sp. TaxID=1872138 RepID=UPI002DDD5703|nr:FAD-dependent oxidoreductase [Actinophytocola sp.]HEV2778220.1 FAD-dependent oxidoreductase [Actinophytocola sp.]